MTVYNEYAQFVADGLRLVTADNLNYHVKWRKSVDGSDYFDDAENKREQLNTISFADYNFSGSTIKSLKLHYESGLLTDQLAIDTMNAEVESDTRPEVSRYTPITVQRDDKVMGMYFNGQIKEIGSRKYSIYAESYITLLDYGYHNGGIYNGQTVGSVLPEIFGDIPYTIAPELSDIKLYGHLPIATKRDNLKQILLAVGACIRRTETGTVDITVLTNIPAGMFADGRVFESGNLTEDTQITAVQVTEHLYVPTDEVITLYEGAFSTTEKIPFSEPAHSLSITGGTIIESGANYALVDGDGMVVLTGKKYNHTTRIMTKGTVLGTPEDKIYTVTDATLITSLNASSVAERLYQYARCNRTIRQDVLINAERTGDIVQVAHPYTEEVLPAAVHSLDFSLSGTLRARAEFLLDYTPKGASTGYKHRAIITESGTWTPPEGVTEVRAVLIGGGQGGQKGSPGNRGDNGSMRSGGSAPSSWGSGNGGDGGDAGSGGAGGKVLDLVIPVIPGTPISAHIGQGGVGGSAGDGTTGGETTFAGASSSGGLIAPYVDIVTAETFAAPGSKGVDGANGTSSRENNSDVYYNGTTWYQGAQGSHANRYIDTTHNGTAYKGYSLAAGGFGGGPAVGSRGGAASSASVGSSPLWVAHGGAGGKGADANRGDNASVPGAGGQGGHGGGGGGGGGDCYPLVSGQGFTGGGGQGGSGGDGGNGAPGCIIIYY